MRNKKIKIVVLLIIIVILLIGIKSIIKKTYPMKYSEYIYKYSTEYNLDPYFVAAVIKTESNFNPEAESKQKARGLMQITCPTGNEISKNMKLKDFTSEKLFQPEYNIKMGCWYINDLKKEFNGNMDLVLAAYNGGRGKVKEWLKDSNHSADGKNLKYIPYKETDKYVKKVKTIYNIYKKVYQKNH